MREVFDLTRPRRTRFSVTQTNKGDRRNQNIIDNTGVIAARVLTSGLVNGMSSPAQEWFKYEPQDLALLEHGPSKQWVNQLQRLVRRIFDASNVYEALPSLYEELILAGTGCAVIEDDFEDVIRLQTFTWGEYAIACNGRRVVDTLYRDFRMTVLQVIERFGLENVSQTVKNCYDRSSYDDWVDVMHCIEPNVDRDQSKADKTNMPFRSIYLEPGSTNPSDKDKFLKKSGYRQNPIIAPRWDVVGNDVYGSSCPGMEALGDMRQLQIQQKRKGEAIDKQVRPPTQGPASLADRFVSQLPGHHNTVANTSDAGIKPLFEMKPDLNAFVADIEDTRGRVNKAFFVDYILAISQIDGVQPRNQWEISERKGEGLMVLGPAVQRISNECLEALHNRTINRIYEICVPLWQRGEPAMIPPPPPELMGMPLQVRYTSVLHQIQKQAGVANIERFINLAANPNVAQIIPGLSKKVNGEQTADILADALGLDAGVLYSDEEMAAQEQQAQQQQQMQQLAAMAPAMKDGADAAKTLSETDVGNGQGALQNLLAAGRDQAEQAQT